MLRVLYVAPWLTDNATNALDAALRIPALSLGVITREKKADVPWRIRRRLDALYRLHGPIDADGIGRCLLAFQKTDGTVERVISDDELVQIPIAETRERFNLHGMKIKDALNFREKPRMKRLLSAAGIACAAFCVASSRDDILKFAKKVGFPLVMKPCDGVRAKDTFVLNTKRAALALFDRVSPGYGGRVLIEEFIDGEEGSCETLCVNGRVMWQSVAFYQPTPLEVKRSLGHRFSVYLPKRYDSGDSAEVMDAGARATLAMGMTTGMTHMEWFRRKDHRLLISEIASRPPGARIPELISHAHETNFMELWTKLVILDHFEHPPPRKYSTGALFFRGDTAARITAVRGSRLAVKNFRHLIVQRQFPWVGQWSSREYDGDGYIIVRHTSAGAVRKGLSEISRLVQLAY